MNRPQIKWTDNNKLYLTKDVREHLGARDRGDFKICICPNNDGTVTLVKVKNDGRDY